MVDLDSRGRLTLPSDLRRSMKGSKKVVLVESGDHIKIIPIPEDPFKALEGALGLQGQSRELRKLVEDEALKEAGRRSPR
ncbi:AbrB/MazE/SpoVT family DNA-binding domain-containing protein [Candidatus Bathyarchaeota archaeon]|nr:AbrB/MazE/SpoVT family DNA-binding domain-containing protein [Candidatus Bathyarchaeota archaeon]